ncbi:hypothetical protein TNCV_2494611 [Trichonephila clavipes]|uniref:Uncharacterized protein n=1 Tax=Trichonephila clavipes TaxID=2585209 RepID=A0A8X6RS42_TRICX|nr:hypothetical protein TNCV_2494611 [Trichonephila clavipes]
MYKEYMDGGQKLAINCKGKLTLTMRGERRLRRTVQLSLHRMGFDSHRPTRIPFLNTHHRGARPAWARELRDCSVEDWKQVA